MGLTGEVEILRDILFAEVERAKLKLLAFTSERLQYRSGDELFHQGDFGDAAHAGIEVMCALVSKLHHTTQALTAARARLNELGKSGD